MTTPFLFAYLSKRRVLNYVKARVNTLMQPNLSIADLRRLPISSPALDVQRQVVDRLDELSIQTERLADNGFRKLAALDKLKTSFLHQAYTGPL